MATTIPSGALVPVAPVFTDIERLALAGFMDDRARTSLARHATYIVAYVAGIAGKAARDGLVEAGRSRVSRVRRQARRARRTPVTGGEQEHSPEPMTPLDT